MWDQAVWLQSWTHHLAPHVLLDVVLVALPPDYACFLKHSSDHVIVLLRHLQGLFSYWYKDFGGA